MTTERIDRPQHSRSDRALIDIVPAPIWIEDWSEVESYCDRQRALGVTDLRSILEHDEATLREVVSLIDVTAVNQLSVEFVGADSSDCLLGRIPGDLLNDGALRSLIVQVMVIWDREASTSVEISGIDMGGSDIACQLDWAAPRSGGQPDYSRVVVLLRDLSIQRAEERLMRRNVAQLETLLDLSRGVASTFDIDLILELLADTSADLTDADGAFIFMFDTEAEVLHKRVARGNSPAGPPPDYRSIENGLSGWCARNRRSTRSDDMGRDERMANLPPHVLDRMKGVPAIVAPIIDDAAVIGSVSILGKVGAPPFSEGDQSIVQMIATQASVSIRNAELYQEISNSRDSVHKAHEDLKNTQTQLLAAQKMEAIGGLAAGIAHEINTPIQFVTDNMRFIKDALSTLEKYIGTHVGILDALADHPEHGERIQQVREQWKKDDCDFLVEEMPDAIAETMEGATRVADIVKAMKEFAHPGQEDLTPSDINRIIETTVQVSRNEWKYVAEVELDLDTTLPMVPALPGPLGQSLLIMIVNSAQAMDSHADGKGKIKISSRHLGEVIEIRVSDNGPGIPLDILDRIFEPFFTTKEIGKGSGQGLSIAHSVIVDKHKGEIWADNTYPGAVFVMHIPVKDNAKNAAS